MGISGRKGVMAAALAAQLMAACVFGRGSLPERLAPDRIDEVSDSVFEVVLPKPVEKANNARHRHFDEEEESFAERNDKYRGIGSAFAIGPNRFVSAAHVFQLDMQAPSFAYALRDRHGKVYAVDKVLRYSQYRDMVEFTVARKIPNLKPLELSVTSRVGNRVYTFGNAEGQGLAVRDGQISSYTLEPVKGAWKDIRFSAPASPGNSGGPLLDTNGDVLGVVVRRNESENLNVGIPIAELKHLESKKAEFFVTGAETRYDEDGPKRDWRFSTALPQTLAKLAKIAEADRRQFQLGLWRASKARKSKDAFPHDTALQDYVWQQRYLPYLSALNKDCRDGYDDDDAMDDDGPRKPTLAKVRSPKEAKSHYCVFDDAYAVKRTGDAPPILATGALDMAELYFITVPDGHTLEADIKNPEHLVDALYDAFDSEEGVNEDERMPPFGKATTIATFADGLGRTWTKSIWRLPYEEESVILNCLPAPAGFACAYMSVPTHYETMGIQERFEQLSAMQLPLSYEGTAAEWQRFLALGPKLVPHALQGVHFVAQNGAVDVKGGTLSAAYRQPLAGSESRLLAGLGFALGPSLALQLQMLRISHGAKLSADEEFQLHFQPGPAASSTDQKSWSEVTAGNRVALHGYGPDEARRVLGMTTAAGRGVAETVTCHVMGEGQGARSPTANDTCRGITETSALAH